jgi:hypothetical protein
MNKLANKLREYLQSDEGKKSATEYFQNIKRKENIGNRHLDIFHNKYGDVDKFVEITDKVISKYNSDNYIKYWYNRGIEPPDSLYWFLFKYAKKYGRKCNKKEWEQYGNTFTAELCFINGYYFNQMNGQGSVVHITKDLATIRNTKIDQIL